MNSILVTDHRCMIQKVSGAWVAVCPVERCFLHKDQHPYVGVNRNEVVGQANSHARYHARLISVDFDELLTH